MLAKVKDWKIQRDMFENGCIATKKKKSIQYLFKQLLDNSYIFFG